jgi:arabinan endo-1,5-alpha-L-arabinosidase
VRRSRLIATAVIAGVAIAAGVAWLLIVRGPTYRNPVYDHDAPDPAVLRAPDGAFYAYTTQSLYGTRLVNIPVLRSPDLVHWTFVRDALPALPRWGVMRDPDSWAPHVIRHDGRYLMYFSERRADDGTMAIGVAIADDPEGPFRDAIGEPLLTGPTFTTIDPFVMTIDSDLWIYWGSAGDPISAQRLTDDGLGLVGQPRIVFERTFGEPYEGLIEGTWLIRHSGYWYLMYSGDACCDEFAHYAVLVARSRSPFGPFGRDPNNPVVAANETFNAPGHNSVVIDDDGRDWLVYHAYVRPDYTFRVMLIDRIEWEAGWPVLEGGPSDDPRSAPALEPEEA